MPSDTLLWSADPSVSLFRGLSPDEQRVSAAQQRNFVAAVVREKPLDVIATAARNSVVQLLSFDLVNNFNYDDGARERFETTIPAHSLEAMKRTRAYSGTMPTAFVETSAMLLSAISLLFVFVFVGREKRAQWQALRGYSLCILAAILINAAICGALSGPKGRYQMRLIWILPVVAAALASRTSRYAQASASRPPSVRTGEEAA